MPHYAENIPWNHYFCTHCFDTCTVALWSQQLSLTPYIPRSLPCFLSPRRLLFFFLHLFFSPLCFSPYLADTFFPPSSLSGAFIDWVQLPDDDGTSAEREPQRDGRRPLHASWLPAKMEGLCMSLSVCVSRIQIKYVRSAHCKKLHLIKQIHPCTHFYVPSPNMFV